LIDGAAQSRVLIILGSARSNGDTAKAASALASRLGPDMATLVDLGSKRILPFDYSEPDQSDDFSALADLMLAHRSLVFATPVYWYAMSGRMKTLFDRLSDLLSGRNPERRGRALAGREAWLLAVGSDPHLPDGFERPFQMTADYLGMRWREGFYVRSGKAADESTIEKLAAELRAAA
jgi:multimeric flavodoxin WrbA